MNIDQLLKDKTQILRNDQGKIVNGIAVEDLNGLINELAAHCERFRQIYDSWGDRDVMDLQMLEKFEEVATSTPKQSLNEIKAQAIEEFTEDFSIVILTSRGISTDSVIEGQLRAKLYPHTREYAAHLRQQNKDELCNYPECKCPFDKGADNKCAKGLKNKEQ